MIEDPGNYTENEYYKRDPKQFMQGYNGYLKAQPNPHGEGREWFESWEAGYRHSVAYQAYVASENARALSEFIAEGERRTEFRKAKQKRHKENRVKRAQEQAAFARQRK